MNLLRLPALVTDKGSSFEFLQYRVETRRTNPHAMTLSLSNKGYRWRCRQDIADFGHRRINTDKQAKGQTAGMQADKQTGSQTVRQINRNTNRQANRRTDAQQRDKHANVHSGR